MTPADAANMIHDAYVANSQVVSAEAANTIREDWGIQCGRVTAMTAEHAAAIARLMGERDQAKDQLAAFKKALDGPVDELNRLRAWAGGES